MESVKTYLIFGDAVVLLGIMGIGVSWVSPVADLHSEILDMHPSRSNFLQFHAVFGKKIGQIIGAMGHSGSPIESTKRLK